MLIAVVGKGRNCAPEVLRLGFDIGFAVGRAGHVVVTGGYAGVMVSAAIGAQAAGGRVLALLPEGRDVPPDFPVDAIVVRTGLSIPVRNVVVGSCCDAMIATHGSHGALQELAVAIDRGVPTLAVETSTWAHLGMDAARAEEVPAWLATLS